MTYLGPQDQLYHDIYHIWGYYSVKHADNSEEGHARLEEEGSSSADFHAMSGSSLSSLLVLKSQSRECALE